MLGCIAFYENKNKFPLDKEILNQSVFLNLK